MMLMARRNRVLRTRIPPPPAWYEITVGTWIEVPGTSTGTLAAINPALNASINPNGTSNAPWLDNQNIIAPWCGATYDATNDVMWIPIAGGHGNYYGNESYKLDLSSGASMAWALHHEPSGSIQYPATLTANGTNFYSDGRPRATHTYNHICHIPGVGQFCLWLSAASPLGSPYATSHPLVMNESTGEWSELGGNVPFTFPHSAVCYDSSRNSVWTISAGTISLYQYSLTSETFTSRGSAQESGYVSLTYLPVDDVIVLTTGAGYTGGTFRVFDPDTNAWTSPTLSGSPPSGFALRGKEHPHWVSSLGCLCMWDNSSNTTKIATLTPGANPRTDAWTWGELTVHASNAVTPSIRVDAAGDDPGTYGRFQYAPLLGGFLLLNSTSQPTYFFKAHA